MRALPGSAAAIRRATLNPADADPVVIGTPVWCWRLAPPVRHHAAQFRPVAFFCTAGGSGEQQVFAELQQLCGKPPLATLAPLAVREAELDPRAHAQRPAQFTGQLQAAEATRAAQPLRPTVTA